MSYTNVPEDLRAIKLLYETGTINEEEAEAMRQFVEGLA